MRATLLVHSRKDQALLIRIGHRLTENRMLRRRQLRLQPLESCVFELWREYEGSERAHLKCGVYLHYFHKE